ncbi:MAG TPA: SAVED domain-containing protein, partial [Candidatus Cloacimonas sp.]|nr:SAVED domain-containing protein [Candidatus Cloacimonas sp.]
ETIPIPIIQYQGEENELIRWQKALEQKVQENFSWFSYELLEDFYGITTNNLAIFGNGILPFEKNAWQTLLKEQVKDKFNALEDKIMPKKVLWFYSGQISTLQIGIGALFGFKRAVSILQMEFSNTTYKEVFTLYGKENARQLKNVSFKKEDFQYIQSELQINDPQKNELGFIIYLGSHNPIGEAKAFCQKNLQVNNFLIIKAKQDQGVMETSQNWLPFVQEINSALNAAREKNHWQRIHLFQTAPIALCMALGIAIGHFVPIDVYHYQFNASEPKYRCMFSMDKILSL